MRVWAGSGNLLTSFYHKFKAEKVYMIMTLLKKYFTKSNNHFKFRFKKIYK